VLPCIYTLLAHKASAKALQSLEPTCGSGLAREEAGNADAKPKAPHREASGIFS
jgi:hypothetical protein